MRNLYRPRNMLQNLFLVSLIYVFADPLASAGLYKWVDDDGMVRYSDRLPPGQIRKSHSRLNERGLVVSTREAARPTEELAAEAEARRKQEEREAEEARVRAIQQQKDQVLLMTFSSIEEIELARDNRLEVLDSVINLIQGNIEHTQERLSHLQNRAENAYISQGMEVPGGLAQKIEHFERKVHTRSRQLELKLDERAKIISKYDSDLARFTELQGGTSASN